MSKGRRKEIAFAFGNARQKLVEAATCLNNAQILIKHSMKRKDRERLDEILDEHLSEKLFDLADEVEKLEDSFLEGTRGDM